MNKEDIDKFKEQYLKLLKDATLKDLINNFMELDREDEHKEFNDDKSSVGDYIIGFILNWKDEYETHYEAYLWSIRGYLGLKRYKKNKKEIESYYREDGCVQDLIIEGEKIRFLLGDGSNEFNGDDGFKKEFGFYW